MVDRAKKKVVRRFLVLDWGRVLGNFDDAVMWGNLAALINPSPDPDIIAGLLTPLKVQFESGAFGKSELFHRAQAILGLETSFQDFARVWKSCIVGPNADIGPVLERLKPDVVLGIMSNTDPLHWEEIARRRLIPKQCRGNRGVTRSFDKTAKARKPSHKIFEAAERKLAVAPDDHVYYVDDIPDYCQVGQGRGWTTLNYDCTKDLIDVLEQWLKEHDLIV